MPFIITLHIMELNFLEEFPDPLYALKAMVDADKILALTYSQKQRLIKEYSRKRILALEMKHKNCLYQEAVSRYSRIIGKKEIDPEKIIVTYLGIDTKLFSIRRLPLPEAIAGLNLPKTARIVMYAGRLIRLKGIDALLKAEPIYNKNGNTHTIILGDGELRSLVEKTGKQRRNIHYLGYIEHDQMPAYHNFLAERAGVFCVPSRSEGLSLVYLETAACGNRIVGCCKSDMGELDFMQKPYTLFAEYDNAQDIADKIGAMLNAPCPNRRAVRKRILSCNSEDMVDRVIEIYRKVLFS